jgi:AraC-like DNA-binding protein
MLSNDGTDLLELLYRNDSPIEPVFHSHPWHEVYYFHEGACNYLIGDQIYALSPGDLILMNGMTLHCPKVDPRVPYIRTVIHFEPSVSKPFLEMPHSVPFLRPFDTWTNFRLALQREEREEVERLLADMQRHQISGGEVARNRMLLVFLDLLHVIYDLCRQPSRGRTDLPSEKERTVQRIVSYIEERYSEDLHMEQLQADLHVSKYHLSRLFKEVTGVTIFDFVFQRRINQAKILFLFDPAMSVTEACFQTGFKHLAHFSRLFKQQVGVTPEKYRKSMKELQRRNA